MAKLIIVTGHAIPYQFDQLQTDQGWYLKPFQTGEGEYYLQHIRRGVEIAAEMPDALLLFSGGQSDLRAGPRSEAQGYWLAADHLNWFGMTEVRERAGTEEFARDSFENLLFSICRFHELLGVYPDDVLVVGWQFKRQRFEMHRDAIAFPSDRFRYVGVNDPADLKTATKGEAEVREYFRNDPFGAFPALQAKREARNPFRRRHGYATSCPELAELLNVPQM